MLEYIRSEYLPENPLLAFSSVLKYQKQYLGHLGITVSESLIFPEAFRNIGSQHFKAHRPLAGVQDNKKVHSWLIANKSLS